ncbi:hypothetical protein LINGRAHAP2_LOCUS35237 [Linum grandiflorum]
MEDSSKSIILIKPAFLKAGIPLAITAAGFAISRIVSSSKKTAALEEETKEAGFAKSRIEEELQSREVEMELESALAIERARAGFLEREISSLEMGKQRFEGLVREYERVVQRLEVANLGNGLLEGKVRRMMRKIRGQERLVEEKGERVGELEAEVLNCLEELERRNAMIDRLEEDVEKLKEEKSDLVVKLSSEQTAAEKQKNEELVAVEDYNRLADELDQGRTNQAAETAELTYLRWTNACLRHELMRSYQLQQQLRSDMVDDESHHHHNKEEEEDCLDVQRSSSSSSPDHHHQQSRRKKLIHKLKKWVEGSDENNGNFHSKNQGNNCIGWMPVHDEGDRDGDVAARRRSCSSF